MEPFDCKCKKVRLCDDCITDEEIIIAAGSMCQFVQSVAKENEMDFMELMEQIYTILDGRGGKKNTWIFIGSSDSGKTTLMDLLLTPYEQHEIGNFKTPLKNANNTFWLENLPGADIYRCEECLLETEDVVQILKALFEGCKPGIRREIQITNTSTKKTSGGNNEWNEGKRHNKTCKRRMGRDQKQINNHNNEQGVERPNKRRQHSINEETRKTCGKSNV